METNQANQKRSRFIDLAKMRKSFALKPLAVGVAGIMLSACSGSREEAIVFTNLDECTDTFPDMQAKCEIAYQQALEEAARTAPKYNTASDCEHEFGANQCRQYSSGGGSFFMPLMAGYMIGNMMSPRPYYQPMFTSYSRSSPYRYRWTTADGMDIGDISKRNHRVRSGAFEKKPAVTRTISRGGFGSSVRAKSNWGSSRSKGWGG
ncbi:DUF1190 domain-containing protein [Glaciecola sp. XM2]|jgi:uncharacterized protein YgiB involved in biofilm formation|uniref:DUF1190 domain-containing protein n=1 Tax=Glaciecola sp. XM2 TaxID=1914931 RepID=UPI001BDEA9BF|nr:DUF1190 domain-containing protein [Glaciecola sp. XM2]MBT1449671.1 DUF1190 domain-containing protein [Glaciecola sp. XM2]